MRLCRHHGRSREKNPTETKTGRRTSTRVKSWVIGLEIKYSWLLIGSMYDFIRFLIPYSIQYAMRRENDVRINDSEIPEWD